MNAETFSHIIHHPELLNKDSLTEIEKLVETYPYIENLRILYALNLLILDDYRYQKHLTKAAFYSSDRKKLKYLIDFYQKKDPIEEDFSVLTDTPEETKEATTPKKHQKETTEKEITPKKPGEDDAAIISQEKELIKERKTKADLLKLVKKRLKEIEDSRLEESERKKENKEISHHDLIDKFIENEPSISRPQKNEFFDPDYKAIESATDDDDFFITETLAKIHSDQKNYQKAKEIYQKLILKFPEKSIYFAARIEDLNKNKKE